MPSLHRPPGLGFLTAMDKSLCVLVSTVVSNMLHFCFFPRCFRKHVHRSTEQGLTSNYAQGLSPNEERDCPKEARADHIIDTILDRWNMCPGYRRTCMEYANCEVLWLGLKITISRVLSDLGLKTRWHGSEGNQRRHMESSRRLCQVEATL